MRLRSASLSRS